MGLSFPPKQSQGLFGKGHVAQINSETDDDQHPFGLKSRPSFWARPTALAQHGDEHMQRRAGPLSLSLNTGMSGRYLRGPGWWLGRVSKCPDGLLWQCFRGRSVIDSFLSRLP